MTAPGTERWRFAVPGHVEASPTVVEDTVYVGVARAGRGFLVAVNRATGTGRWHFETRGGVKAAPAVVDGTAYASAYDLYAVDAGTGDRRWQHGYGLAGRGTRSSPTVADGTVHVGTSGGSLRGVDRETGGKRWSFAVDEPRSVGIDDGRVYSPTVVDGAVYVPSGHTQHVYRIRPPDPSDRPAVTGRLRSWFGLERGTEEWRFGTDSNVYSSPTVYDGTVYVGSGRSLYAIEAGSGTRRWRFETRGEVRSSPTVCEGTVFVGSYDGRVYAVNAEDGTERWSFETHDEVRSSPTVAGRTVYVGSEDGHLYALDSATGAERWRFEAGAWVRSPPIVVDGTVYVGSREHLYAVATAHDRSSRGSRVLLGTLGHHDRRVTTDPATVSAAEAGSDTTVYAPGESGGDTEDTSAEAGGDTAEIETDTAVFVPDEGDEGDEEGDTADAGTDGPRTADPTEGTATEVYPPGGDRGGESAAEPGSASNTDPGSDPESDADPESSPGSRADPDGTGER